MRNVCKQNVFVGDGFETKLQTEPRTCKKIHNMHNVCKESALFGDGFETKLQT